MFHRTQVRPGSTPKMSTARTTAHTPRPATRGMGSGMEPGNGGGHAVELASLRNGLRDFHAAHSPARGRVPVSGPERRSPYVVSVWMCIAKLCLKLCRPGD